MLAHTPAPGGDPHGGEELYLRFCLQNCNLIDLHDIRRLLKYIDDYFWEQAFRNLKKRRGDYHRHPENLTRCSERRTRNSWQCHRCMVRKHTRMSLLVDK